MADHRSPSGHRARAASPASPAAAPRAGAHRAPRGGVRAQVVATAAAIGAVATGTLTALLPGATPADAAPDPRADAAADAQAADSVLAASAGVLRTGILGASAQRPAGSMLPVAYAVDDDSAVDERLASVEKAGRLAAQLAELHAREARTAGLIRRGGLDGWIAQALQIMNLPQDLAPGVKQIILAESGGNPQAINRWDSNALRGTPSRGLMQTIPSTFRSYVHPELSDRPITDPVANITAGVRYMVDRYGVDTVRAGGRSTAAGSYLGY